MSNMSTVHPSTAAEVIEPELVGIDPRRLDVLLRRIRLEVESGFLPSAQVAVARHGKLVTFQTWGNPEVDAEVPRYITQSVGRTYVAAGAWKLISDGKLALTERVADVIPEFGANGKESVTVEQVLTHTGGFPLAPLGYPKMADRDARLAAFSRWRLVGVPGEKFEFHLTASGWLIAEMIERRTGLSLPDYLRTVIAEPLGLDFGLAVALEEQQATVAPMRCVDGDGTEVDPWGPWYLDNPDIVAAGEPSHAVVANAADVALLYQAVLESIAGSDRIWSPAVAADAVRLRVLGSPFGGHRRTGMALFIVVAGPDADNGVPTVGSETVFGNAGAAYQLGFADPVTGVSISMLCNGYPSTGYDRSRKGTAMMHNITNLAADLA